MEPELRIFQIHDKCTGCGACVMACQHDCLDLQSDNEGFLYPQMAHADKCVQCRLCENVCHVLKNRYMPRPQWWEKSAVFMFWHKDACILENSTSGGAFTLFANYIQAMEGVVFASKYNRQKARLEFDCTDRHQLSLFRGSRYFESNTNNIFPEVKKQLNAGRHVLFCGTPCHVSSLKSYLMGREYNNLITMDFICHGVPSNKYFSEYLSGIRGFEKIDNVNFRKKDFSRNIGWNDLNLYLVRDGRIKYMPAPLSSFYQGFYENILLRKSCYQCNIINNTAADITIGDFWGIKYYKPELDNNRGISLIILHSDKVKELFRSLKDKGHTEPLPYSAIEYAFRPRQYPVGPREEAMTRIRRKGLNKFLSRKYLFSKMKYNIGSSFPILLKIYKWIKK